MGAKERLRDRVERLVVFRTRETVTFIREDHVGDGNLTRVHRGDDLITLAQFHSWIVRTLSDQQWPGNSIDMDQRGNLIEPFRLIRTADSLLEHHLDWFPVGGNRRQKRSDV